MSNGPGVDPQLQQILKSLEGFGFKFFGYNESKQPLVIAPNGQVVSVDVAYKFVQTQLIQPSKTGGAEAMPQIPNMPIQVPDANLDIKLDVEKSLEQNKAEKKQESQFTQPTQTAVPHLAPKVAAVDPKIEVPIGAGFYPKAFDPTDVEQAQKFVANNAQKDDKSSTKWLAIMWKKFIEELASNT